MNAADLWPEIHAAARNLSPAHLTRLGIAADDAIAAGGLGVAKISAHSDAHFELGGEIGAVLLPVYWGEIPTEDVPVPDCELEDILAFDPDQPDRWWLRRGDACLLGASALDGLYLGAELWVRRNPLSWLKNSARGCVVLDWQRAASRLRAVATLVPEDAEHGIDVQRRLQQPLLIPEIRVPYRAQEKAT